jgi:DNA-binding transcriptional ArsR family regulator
MNGQMTMNGEILAAVPITDLEALRALVDSQRHRIVTLLMEEPLTAKELADRLGIGRTRLYYHLAMLEQHGLIRVVETRIVSGIAERKYRSVARTFRVDRGLLAAHASEVQISDTHASIIDAVANDLRARAASGGQASDADLLVSRAFLCLSDERRRELRSRLAAMVDEYRSGDQGGTETEVAIALFTPEARAR